MIILFGLVLFGGVGALAMLPITLLYNADLLAFKHRYGICMEPGCWRRGADVTECFFPDNYDWHSPDEFLCYDHIEHSGFCRGCGQFWAGIESFDFWHPGWCDNCWDEIRANEYDDYEDDYDGWFDPYEMDYGPEYSG